MALGRYPFEDEQQDPFESSFFQQPQAASPPPAPMMDAAPAAGPPASGLEVDPFASSFFAQGPGPAGSGAAPRSPSPAAPSASFRAPGAGGLQPTTPRPPAASGQQQPPSFDYAGLMAKVRTSVDPREKAIATDSVARQTFQQLKAAGHDVKWQGDQLAVDGRPYVIGDGAAPATPPAPGGKTPPVGGNPDLAAAYQQNPTRNDFQGGAASAGATSGGAPDAQSAYDQFASSVSPNASREEMEAAIEAAFGHLPGYGGAYKESVMLNGQWYDTVVGYGGANASFGGLTPKGPSSQGMASGFGSSLMSSLMSPFGGSGGGFAQSSGGAEGARGVELASSLDPAILAYLKQQSAEPEPTMAPSYLNLLQPSVR